MLEFPGGRERIVKKEIKDVQDYLEGHQGKVRRKTIGCILQTTCELPYKNSGGHCTGGRELRKEVLKLVNRSQHLGAAHDRVAASSRGRSHTPENKGG